MGQVTIIGAAHDGSSFTVRLSNGQTCFIHPLPGEPVQRYGFTKGIVDESSLIRSIGSTIVVGGLLQFELVRIDDEADMYVTEYRGRVS